MSLKKLDYNGLQTLVTAIKSYMRDNYLSLTGGTIDGQILLKSPTGKLVGFQLSSNDPEASSYRTNLDIGWNWVNKDGAGLGLRSVDHNSDNPGGFSLYARNSTNDCYLEGFPSGVLKWGGYNVITSAGGYINGNTHITNARWFYFDANKTNGDYSYLYSNSDSGAGFYIETHDNTRVKSRIVLRNTGSFEIDARHSNGTGRTLSGSYNGNLVWNGQVIQTSSDKRLKQDFSNVFSDVLDTWENINWIQFKYKEDVEEKGINNCRWHTGLVAQDVKEVGEKDGIDLCKYGILCHELHEKTEEKDAIDLWTIRYEEALCMEAAYQRRKNKQLEDRIKLLEEKLENI